jgi:branched-chain amino acid transport system substrate-binding protein
MTKKCKAVLLFALAVVVLIALIGCGPQTSSSPDNSASNNQSEEIKIGVIFAETGPASTLGASQVKTAKLFQKQLDAAGPINGKKIKFIIQDYETDDTKAVIAMDRLISQGVVGVIGATQQSATMAILPKAVSAKLPFHAQGPIVNVNEENVFAFAPSTKTVTTLIADWLKKNNITKVAWINAKDAFGVDGLPTFEKLAKDRNIEVVAHEEFEATATDMSVQLTNIKKKNPEAVIVWSRTPGAGVVARNFMTLGFNVPMIQSHAAANKGFLDQVKDNNKGIYVVGSKLSVVDQLPDSPQKKRLLEFRDAYKAEYKEDPDLFAAQTIDSFNIMTQAIKAGKTKPEEIIKYFNTEMGKYEGVTGTFDFKQDKSSPQSDGLTLLGISNNQWKYNE